MAAGVMALALSLVGTFNNNYTTHIAQMLTIPIKSFGRPFFIHLFIYLFNIINLIIHQ